MNTGAWLFGGGAPRSEARTAEAWSGSKHGELRVGDGVRADYGCMCAVLSGLTVASCGVVWCAQRQRSGGVVRGLSWCMYVDSKSALSVSHRTHTQSCLCYLRAVLGRCARLGTFVGMNSC